MVTIPIWTLLLSLFITWRIYNDKQISHLDTAYWKSADENKKNGIENWRGDESIWKKLKESKLSVKKYNTIFLNAIFLQTILTFIAQVIGYKTTTTKKIYKWTAIAFGILLVINLCLVILMAIVPTGPFF
jgi:hypothetical protein